MPDSRFFTIVAVVVDALFGTRVTARAIISAAMSADVVREIPMSEAQVVDSCFEEDAYQSGISLLNQMRATDTKPRS